LSPALVAQCQRRPLTTAVSGAELAMVAALAVAVAVVVAVETVAVLLCAQAAPTPSNKAMALAAAWCQRENSAGRSLLRTGGLEDCAGFEGFAAGRLVEIVVVAGIQNGPG
jgi:hypothetical protein